MLSRVRAQVFLLAIDARGDLIAKLGVWLQQIVGATLETSVQKRAVLVTAKILCRPQTPTPGLKPEMKLFEWMGQVYVISPAEDKAHKIMWPPMYFTL